MGAIGIEIRVGVLALQKGRYGLQFSLTADGSDLCNELFQIPEHFRSTQPCAVDALQQLLSICQVITDAFLHGLHTW